jgi:hypothetical protein
MMLPSLWAERARYAGVSATRLKPVSVAGVGMADPPSVAGLDEATDSARETSVTGGGLQRSKIGSSEAARRSRVFRGAMTAQVVMEL